MVFTSRTAFTAAHPRSRGEHEYLFCLGCPASGSSPLARGTLAGDCFVAGGVRLIPARAGNTFTIAIFRLLQSAHPRSRGEHRLNVALLISQSGSSPLARGTRTPYVPETHHRRLIPARAGNTSTQWRWVALWAAHPRSRGEHDMEPSEGFCGNGSSPLARGTRADDGRAGLLRRLIPARAGNTGRTAEGAAGSAAHPRSRGEHVTPKVGQVGDFGSSPLARGTLSAGTGWLVDFRLIPARAGNTGIFRNIHRRPAAHPRSRGEHGDRPGVLIALVGSSPLARGTRVLRAMRRRTFRLIPARAGNTWCAPRRFRACAAHPRSRGEHHQFPNSIVSAAGSSPLARGTLSS